jgi:hypothetical protein
MLVTSEVSHQQLYPHSELTKQPVIFLQSFFSWGGASNIFLQKAR